MSNQMSPTVVGITGPGGFIASHLIHRLNRDEQYKVRLIPRKSFEDVDRLSEFVTGCDCIVHLAGMNRGEEKDIYRINVQLAEKLTAAAVKSGCQPHIIFSSSTQAGLENVYGQSKQKAEEILADWATKEQATQTSLVIPNVYGAGGRPFYNSVVATFCHQLTHGDQPQVLQDKEIELIGVNQLVDKIVNLMGIEQQAVTRVRILGECKLAVTELLSMLEGFRESYFERQVVPDISDRFVANLYATFLSYLELDDHRHIPEVHSDPRGDLFEVIKMDQGGQVFFSTTKPGVIRGNHYHTRKVEWFCVVKGEATIRMRQIGETSVKEFKVSGDQPQFISIPIFYTHHIENTGKEELLTMFWCNELFDVADPDTFYVEVFNQGEEPSQAA